MNLTRILATAALAITGTGVGLTAPAVAATTPDVYIHGTTRMASYASRGTCNVHAATEVRKVTTHSAQAQMVAAWPYFGYPDPSERMTCCPVQGGRWSYIVAYKALSGKPLSPVDKLYPRTGSATLDAEAMWAFSRYREYPSAKKCERAFNATLAKVVDARNRKLSFGTYPCMSHGPEAFAFLVGYFATSSSAGLRGDTPLSHTFNVLNQNGWAPPYSPWF